MTAVCAHPVCAHCRAPVAQQQAVLADIDGRQALFCCTGCASAAHLINALGMDDYYRFRDDQQAQPAAGLTDAELQMFALDDVTASAITRRGDSSTLRLLIEGIHCAACVWLLEKVLSTLPGVRGVTVNLATYVMHITWQGTATTPATIAARVAELGYRPRLPMHSGQQVADQRAQRWLLARLLVAGLGAMQAMMYAVALYVGAFDGIETIYRDFFRIAGLVVATPVVFFSGWPFFSSAWRMLRHRHVSMEVPVALALLLGWGGSVWATWYGGEHVYFESISMFVFFLLTSRWIEQRQRHKVAMLFARLQADLPAAVTRVDEAGDTLVASRMLRAGDRFRVAQGDVIPVDAVIRDGTAQIEQAALTGESVPVQKHAGDMLAAGSRLLEGLLTLEAQSRVDDSRLARIGELVERAQGMRPFQSYNPSMLAGVFVVAVLLLSAITFALHWSGGANLAFEHALAVLVVTCPCALALAAPLTLAATLGRGLEENVLIADPVRLMRLPHLRHWVFDKTGTLTRGHFVLRETEPLAAGVNLDELYAVVAGLEQHARHPLAEPLRALAAPAPVSDISLTRNGVSGQYQGHRWHISSAPAEHSAYVQLHLYRDDQPVLRIALQDTPRDEAHQVLSQLRSGGNRVYLSSGDQPGPVAHIATALPIDESRAQQTPADKQTWVEALHQQGGVVLVGDGVNDASAMLDADVSIAVAESAALTRDAAHLYLLAPGLGTLPWLVRLARQSARVFHQNLAWALGYNVIAVPFAMAGLVPPWLAALGMSLSSLVVTLNAVRLTRWKS